MTLGRRSGQMLRIFSADNFFKYWRYCQIYGIRNATRLAIRRLRKPMGIQPTHVTPLSLPAVGNAEDLAEPINKTVSVVIPTKNAARYIQPLLEKLKCQRGVRPPQIILVDSGSTDGTVSLAERAGVTLVQIAPEEFTHAFSRNKGSEKATGDYILFTVQDALPLTNLWLWEMVKALEDNNLAAVSCAEYPRSDSDLFYQFSIHSQYNLTGLEQNRILAWDESCSSYLGLRSNAQLSDVAALIRRDIFETYRFKTSYAEDVDLGIRLIRDGQKLGFLHSTRVLHSHNRSSYHFLKRGYVDARFLIEVFPDAVFPEVDSKSKLYCDIVMMCQRVNQVSSQLSSLRTPLPIKELTDQFLTMLSFPPEEPAFTGEALSGELRQFVEPLSQNCYMADSRSVTKTNMIFPHVMDHIERFQKWVCSIYDAADDRLARNVVSALEKICALHSGTHLGYLYLTEKNRGKLDASLVALDQRLTADI